MKTIDIGANLTHESFAPDLDQVIARAKDAGVTQMMITGASGQGSADALALAKKYPGYFFATCGNHPHYAEAFDARMAEDFAEIIQCPEVKAAGEMGLDYFRDLAPRPKQKYAFESQLELAVTSGKPAFLHQRDAHDDFLAIMREYRDHLSQAVVHCFTDTAKALSDYLDLDLHIGITGWICDERRGAHLKDLVASIPANRLMVETDSPYLMPRDLKPKPKSRRNEPMHLPHILREVARCRGEEAEVTAASTVATAQAFFDLDEPPG
ncbi:MAG: TatD family hydrolase [Lysobacterales bacterium]